MSHRRRHSHRLLTTLFVVLSLLFTQLALARHLCSGMRAAPAAVAPQAPQHAHCDMVDDASMAQAETPTTSPDPSDGLCQAHCADPAKQAEPVVTPQLTLPAVLLMVALTVTAPAESASPLMLAAAPPQRPPPDPLFLATLRLRV